MENETEIGFICNVIAPYSLLCYGIDSNGLKMVLHCSLLDCRSLVGQPKCQGSTAWGTPVRVLKLAHVNPEALCCKTPWLSAESSLSGF